MSAVRSTLWLLSEWCDGNGKLEQRVNKLRTSNWGRWGVDDQRGTLNMLTPEHVGQVVRTPSRGKGV